MKKKWGILVVIILLGVLAAAAWTFLRPNNPLVIKGDLAPEDVAAIKSLVKKDMAKRLLPDCSWASFKSLVPDLRAYFRYHVVEIDARGTYNTRVDVGDGLTFEASKHICEYVLRKDAKGWSMIIILSPRMTSLWRPRNVLLSPANLAPARPLVGAVVPQRRDRTAASNSVFFTNSRLPFRTNLPVPHMTLGAEAAWRNFPQPSLQAGGSPRSATNDSALVLRPPSTAGYIGGAMTMGPPTNGVPRITFGAPTAPLGVIFPNSSGSLTNLMPLGN